jgi:hypothetical protein
MKKLILVAAVLVVIGATGYVTARLQKSQLRFPPHTIVYRMTYYDESEKQTYSEIIIRRVEPDGTWKHTQVRPDGSVVVSNGKLKSLFRPRHVDNNSPEHLGVRYVRERNDKGDTDSWFSPELQDLLLFTTFREDGSKETEMKAVDISRP